MSNLPITSWLPITKDELQKRGWSEVDVIIVSGDAYVDHPSFGAAVIGRILEHEGYKVAIIPQPNWKDDLRDFKKFGKPRLFFGVTAGCMDSMVNHYTANKRLRSDDAYTPNNQAGFRPDYPSIVYTKILKQIFPDTPVILGGIEASLRRVTHYDYWQDKLLPSILIQSGADMLSYGMGEKTIVEIAKRLDKGEKIGDMHNVPQTAFVVGAQAYTGLSKNWTANDEVKTLYLVSHEESLSDKKAYAGNFKIIEEESNKIKAARLVQPFKKNNDKNLNDNQFVIINPPYPTFSQEDMDQSFDLPYTRLPHPKYKKRGPIPAYEMIRHSINIHRGCFGGCAFCTISAHQGKHIASRSEQSILKELQQVVEMDDFKGYLSDLGGPSANMYQMTGKTQSVCEKCARYSCIHPQICKNLNVDHKPLLNLYKKVAEHPKVKKVFIGSGIRYDLFDNQSTNPDFDYADYVIRHCVSGRLKVAPEHTEPHVLNLMRKPKFERFVAFKSFFDDTDRRNRLRQQLIPYFISSHPGCRLEDMKMLATKTKNLGYRLEAVQDFTPTPMTLATEIYYSGYHPYTLEPVYCAKNKIDKQAQNEVFFWWKTKPNTESKKYSKKSSTKRK